jgi:hypothetical protein
VPGEPDEILKAHSGKVNPSKGQAMRSTPVSVHTLLFGKLPIFLRDLVRNCTAKQVPQGVVFDGSPPVRSVSPG